MFFAPHSIPTFLLDRRAFQTGTPGKEFGSKNL